MEPARARTTRDHVYVGVDVGTSSLKALAVSAAGQMLGVETAAYRLEVPRPGWAEQHPDAWWAAACVALRRLTARLAVSGYEVAAVGLSGQMHGATLLDEDGRVLRPTLTWADSRGIPASSALFERLSPAAVRRITGSAPHASSTLAKLWWVRTHEPEVWDRIAHVLLAKDELRRQLTDVYATDPSDASGTLLYDLRERRWSPAILDALGLRAQALPEVRAASDLGGHVTAQAALSTGLRVGTPVAIGGGDAECAAFGARLGEAGGPATGGDVLVTLGTAGQVFALVNAPLIDDTDRVHTLCYVTTDRWHVMGAILSAGYTLAWLAAMLAQPDVSELLAEAARVPAGADGLLCVPSLLGERGGPAGGGATAAFVGLSAAHSRGHLARAAMEGVAFALRERLAAIGDLGVPLQRVVLVGGPTADGLWRRLVADVLALPTEAAKVPHSSALGAARLAARAIGDEIARAESGSAPVVTMPQAPDAATYDRHYLWHRATSAALASLRIASHAPTSP